MKLFKCRPGATGSRSSSAIGLLLLALLAALTLASSAGAAATSVPLQTADSFVVLAGAGIANSGSTTVTGDIGTSPTATIAGTDTLTVIGINHGGDAVTVQAKTDLGTAYDNAAGQAAVPIVGDLGGQVLTPGVYNSGSSIGLTGALTLDAVGNRNAVFVFQAGSTLTTASSSQVDLINGAQSCNVFWQVGSSATLGDDSSFRGTILAMVSITVNSGVIVDGRVLARDGAVTLNTNRITRPTCLAPTAVATGAFSAQGGGNRVSLRWRTTSEVDILAFNVYGQYGAKRVRLNQAVIAGTATGTVAGRGYLFVDHLAGRAKASRYWLQVVHLDGSWSWSGSARALGRQQTAGDEGIASPPARP